MMSNKEEIKYPVVVFLNGRIVGEMDRRGVVTFTDSSAINDVTRMMAAGAVGLSHNDKTGMPFKDNAVHFNSLGPEEDNKMELKRIQLNKKKGRML